MHIQPYSDNAKKHPEKQVKMIADSIKRFGWQQPIVVDKNGIIIVGHGRYQAWQKYPEGMDEPWITDNEGNTLSGKQGRELTAKEVAAYRLADNKLNESDWDMELAIEELHSIDDPALQELTGFDMDLLLEPDEEDDVIPETPEEPRSKLGDLYELGGHRVLCGDSTKVETILTLLGDKKADMYLTDPPYNVAYEGKTKDALTIENDSMADGEFRTFLKEAFTAAFNVMKPGAVFYIWHADSEGYNFRGAIHDIGEKVRQCLIWNKNSMVMGRQDYQWKHEPCLYGWKDGASHLWNSDRRQTTVLEFDRPTRSAEHPTMKPVDLIAYQITNNTKGEDIVLDSFLGSGTTLIAAQKTGRICYGTELSPQYVDVVIQRYVDYVDNPVVLLNGNDVTHLWPKTKEKTKDGTI